MTDTIVQLREGDIYRWRYCDPKTDSSGFGSYHCCSCIAVVHSGRLRDTYWQIGKSFSDGRSFGAGDLAKLNLTRLGNFEDLERAPEYQADYYADSDIVNLNHSNSTRGNFYLRKGAVRSQVKMLEVAQRNLGKAKLDGREATRRSRELCDTIARIEAGDTTVHIIS